MGLTETEGTELQRRINARPGAIQLATRRQRRAPWSSGRLFVTSSITATQSAFSRMALRPTVQRSSSSSNVRADLSISSLD